MDSLVYMCEGQHPDQIFQILYRVHVRKQYEFGGCSEHYLLL